MLVDDRLASGAAGPRPQAESCQEQNLPLEERR